VRKRKLSTYKSKQTTARINEYQLYIRPRQHNFVLTTKTDDRNFIVRHLFSDIYWHCLLFLW